MGGAGEDGSDYRSGLSLQPRPPGTPAPGEEEEAMIKHMVKSKGGGHPNPQQTPSVGLTSAESGVQALVVSTATGNGHRRSRGSF